MAISMAVYNTIRQIVDERIDTFKERIEEIRVERKDFDELKGEVTKLTISVDRLAEAQVKTEQKVEKLEESVDKLAVAQAKTEQKVGRLEESVDKLAVAQAKTEQKVEELAMAQAKTEQKVEELAVAQAKTEQAIKHLSINISGLSDTIGFGLEDIARTVVPGYLERHENIYIEELQRGFIEVDGVEREIDLFGECNRDGETILIIGEVKSRIYEGEVKKFVSNVINPIRKSEKERRIYPLMFGYVIHPSAQRLAKAEGVHLVASYQR